MSAWILSRANVSRETCDKAANSSGPKLFASNGSMASHRACLELSQNQSQRRRCYCRAPPALAKRQGFDSRQFQPAFRGKPNHRVIVEVGRQKDEVVEREVEMAMLYTVR